MMKHDSLITFESLHEIAESSVEVFRIWIRANPIGKIVQELLDDALELRDNALKNQNVDGSDKTPQQKMQGCIGASTKLKKLITGDSRDEDFKGVEKLLEDARRNNEPTNLIQEALKTIQRYQQDVYKAATGK